MKNKTNRSARDQMVLDALAKHFTSSAKITLNGVAHSVKELQSQYQAEMDAAKTTQSARTAWEQALLAEETTVAETTAVTKALRAHVIGTYGATSSVVADFGFTPKTTTPDVATKAQAVAARAATRKARGTMGKKQRLEITGTTPATIASAAPAPASATTPPKPASAS